MAVSTGRKMGKIKEPPTYGRPSEFIGYQSIRLLSNREPLLRRAALGISVLNCLDCHRSIYSRHDHLLFPPLGSKTYNKMSWHW